MSKYLTPTADLTFKKVSGQHPDLMMSLQNAMLPLPDGKEITGIKYLPAKLLENSKKAKGRAEGLKKRKTEGIKESRHQPQREIAQKTRPRELPEQVFFLETA